MVTRLKRKQNSTHESRKLQKPGVLLNGLQTSFLVWDPQVVKHWSKLQHGAFPVTSKTLEQSLSPDGTFRTQKAYFWVEALASVHT